MLLFYDFEVFKYDWLVVIIDPINGKETVIVNDIMRLKQFYNDHKGDIWIGFNNRGYDQYILKGIICGFDPYEISDWIVRQRKKGWEFSNVFNRIPLISYDVMTGFNGLKTLEAFMGNDIRETTVPFDIDRKLNKEEIDQTIFYCRHDVQQTIEVFLRRKNEFDSQMELIKEFNLPLSDLGKTQAQLAAKILGSKRIDFDDEFDLFLPDTLKLDKYQFVADWFMSLKTKAETELGPMNCANQDEWRKFYYSQKLETTIAGIPHVFGFGGIHGSDDNCIYECDSGEILIMSDVGAMYPTMMVKYDLLSRAVYNKNRFINILNTSFRLKREGNKKRREPYKRITNIVYGATRDKFNPMYDPRNGNLICLFGQLLLLDLVEKLEPYTKMKQNNTDGTFFLVKLENLPTVKTIIKEWEERTGLEMEQDTYIKMIQKDVNNYIVIPTGPLYNDKGEPRWKCKGAYVKALNDLDYDLPIINEALTEYFVNDIPINTTINNCDELIKFQKVVKLSGKYNFVEHNGSRYSEKCYRVFASKDNTDGQILKCKEENKKDKFANTPDHCFIDNGDIKGKKISRKLDIDWYINLANKRLAQFLGKEKEDIDE